MWKLDEGIDSPFEDAVQAYQMEARRKRVLAYAAEYGVSREEATAAIPPINFTPREEIRWRESKAFQLREQAANEGRLQS